MKTRCTTHDEYAIPTLVDRLYKLIRKGNIAEAEYVFKYFGEMLPNEIRVAFGIVLFKRDMDKSVLCKMNETVDSVAQFHKLFRKEVV